MLLESAINLQQQFLRRCGDSIEQALQFGIMFMPVSTPESGQVGFQEQAMYCLSDVFSLYRSFVLRQMVPKLVNPSRDNRRLYTALSFLLRGLRSVQVLFEIYAHRKGGRKSAIRMCFKIECIKLFLKSILATLMPFPILVDDETMEAHSAKGIYVGKRGGLQLPSFESSSQCEEAHPTQRSSPAQALAEGLHHLRPLVHLLVLNSRGEDKWSWLAGVLPEILSLRLLLTSSSCELTTQEIRRRTSLIAWAFIRSPCFDTFVKGPLLKVEAVWKCIPLLKYLNIIGLFLLLQPYYFTTSGT